MAYTTINKGSSYFNTVTYTGTGASNSVTGVGFKPDWVWVKSRSLVRSNQLNDIVRGAGIILATDNTSAEFTDTNRISSFNVDGFSLGTNDNVNGSGATYVGWNWLGSNTTVSNTQGTVTSTVSANTTSGFSVVGFTTIAGVNATIGHGLGSVPKMIIMKARDQSYNWDIYHVSIGNANRLLFTTAGSAATPCWGSTTPTSSVFTMDQSFYGSGIPTIAYCFAEVKGYSKMGSYTGNGSTNGPFVYTGFKPAFLIAKRTDSTGNWRIRDDVRSPYNVITDVLYPNSSSATITEDDHDFLSNGFKVRTTGPENNASGGTYIYMAFAENPFVTSGGIPVTAR